MPCERVYYSRGLPRKSRLLVQYFQLLNAGAIVNGENVKARGQVLHVEDSIVQPQGADSVAGLAGYAPRSVFGRAAEEEGVVGRDLQKPLQRGADAGSSYYCPVVLSLKSVVLGHLANGRSGLGAVYRLRIANNSFIFCHC